MVANDRGTATGPGSLSGRRGVYRVKDEKNGGQNCISLYRGGGMRRDGSSDLADRCGPEERQWLLSQSMAGLVLLSESAVYECADSQQLGLRGMTTPRTRPRTTPALPRHAWVAYGCGACGWWRAAVALESCTSSALRLSVDNAPRPLQQRMGAGQNTSTPPGAEATTTPAPWSASRTSTSSRADRARGRSVRRCPPPVGRRHGSKDDDRH